MRYSNLNNTIRHIYHISAISNMSDNTYALIGDIIIDISGVHAFDDLEYVVSRLPYYNITDSMITNPLIACDLSNVQKSLALASVIHLNPSIFTLSNMIVSSGIDLVDPHTLEYIVKNVTGISCDVYSWYRLSRIEDYARYRHNKNQWDVQPNHPKGWIAKACKLGIPMKNLMYRIGDTYPGLDGVDFIPDAIQAKVDAYNKNRTCGQKYTTESKADTTRKEWLMLNTSYGHYDVLPTNLYFTLMSYDQASSIFTMCVNIGSIDYAILFAIRLMVSTQVAHLSIKNPPIMAGLTKIMNKYPKTRHVIYYCMWYALRTLTMEERILGKKIQSTCRSVWTEDQFMALPIYTDHLSLAGSPYIQTMSGYNTLYSQLPYYVVGRRRITTRDEYMERARYGSRYAGHKSDIKSVHDVIPYSKWCMSGVTGMNRVNLSGGWHHACCSIQPTELNYRDMQHYMDVIYPGNESISIEVNGFYKIAKIIAHKLNTVIDDCGYNADKIIGRLISAGYDANVSYTAHPNDDNFANDEKLPAILKVLIRAFRIMNHAVSTVSDMDISIQCDTHAEYVTIVTDIFNALKSAGYDNIWMRKIPRVFGFKYCIMGMDLTRPIDLYRVNVSDVQLMRRFHLDPVRIFWNGIQRCALTSSVCYHMSGVVSTMCFMSSKKDPITIAMRYIGLGCSIFMNKSMIDILRKAVLDIEPFNKYPFVVGPVLHNHGIFVDKLVSRNEKKYMNNDRQMLMYVDRYVTNNGINVCVPNVDALPAYIADAFK